MYSRADKGGRRRGGGCGVQHHGRVDSSVGAAISPRPLSGLVCATEAGATSPNLTYWLSPDRIYIQSRGWEGAEGGTNQSKIPRSRQYKQRKKERKEKRERKKKKKKEENREQTDRMWGGSVHPCQAKLSLTKMGGKGKRERELGFFMAAPLTHSHICSHTYTPVYLQWWSGE